MAHNSKTILYRWLALFFEFLACLFIFLETYRHDKVIALSGTMDFDGGPSKFHT